MMIVAAIETPASAQRRQTVTMEEGHDGQHRVVPHLRAGPGMNLRRVGDQVAMRERDDLGVSGGAAGGQQEGRRVERLRTNRLEGRIGLLDLAIEPADASLPPAGREEPATKSLGAIGELLPTRESIFERGQDRDLGLMSAAPDERREHVERDHNSTVGCRHEGRDLFATQSGLMATAEAPAIQMPLIAARNSGTFGSKMPTRSPGRTPNCTRRCAVRRAESRSWRYVNW